MIWTTVSLILVALVAAVAIGAVAYWARRREGQTAALLAAQAAGEAWRAERDAEKAQRERIEAELGKARRKIAALEARVDELEKRPDMRSLELLVEARTDRILAALEKTGGPS
ncbi:MAG: hypothetical protein IT175_06210 [Acidobacteria bacterium]|nr:hypothetical protein [Acidobacteriota bacterium]